MFVFKRISSTCCFWKCSIVLKTRNWNFNSTLHDKKESLVRKELPHTHAIVWWCYQFACVSEKNVLINGFLWEWIKIKQYDILVCCSTVAGLSISSVASCATQRQLSLKIHTRPTMVIALRTYCDGVAIFATYTTVNNLTSKPELF